MEKKVSQMYKILELSQTVLKKNKTSSDEDELFV